MIRMAIAPEIYGIVNVKGAGSSKTCVELNIAPNFYSAAELRDAAKTLNALADVLEPDGWIEWKGGECPETDHVTVTLRSGKILNECDSKFLRWSHDDDISDIVKYRVVKK